MEQDCSKDLLNSDEFSLEISWRVSCPRLEADLVASSAGMQAECDVALLFP